MCWILVQLGQQPKEQGETQGKTKQEGLQLKRKSVVSCFNYIGVDNIRGMSDISDH